LKHDVAGGHGLPGWGAASASVWRGVGLQANFVELHLLPHRRPPVRPLR
jgi:hypothetical protein